MVGTSNKSEPDMAIESGSKMDQVVFSTFQSGNPSRKCVAKMIPLFLAPKTNQKAPETSRRGQGPENPRLPLLSRALVDWSRRIEVGNGSKNCGMAILVWYAKPSISIMENIGQPWISMIFGADHFDQQNILEHPNAAGPDKLSIKFHCWSHSLDAMR